MMPPHRDDSTPRTADQRERDSPWQWQSPWSLDDDDLWDTMPSPPPVAKAAAPMSKKNAARRADSGKTTPAAQSPAIKKDAPTDAAVPAAEGQLSAAARAAEQALLAAAAKPARTGPLRSHLKTRSASQWLGLILLWLGLAGFVFFLWVYLQEMPQESDEDLRIQQPVDQALTTGAPGRLRSLLDAVVPLDSGQPASSNPWDWSTPMLSRFVTANGTTLDNLRDLLEDEDWHPRHSLWLLHDLGSHRAWGQLNLLLKAEAAYVGRRADEEAAFTSAIDIAELSRRLQEIAAWPSFMARAHELHLGCVEIMAHLLEYTRLDSEHLRHFQEQFATCLPSDQVVQDTLNAYYLHEKKLLLGSTSGVPFDTMPSGAVKARPRRFFFKTRDTINLFANAFRELKSDIVAPRYATVAGPQSLPATGPFYQPNAAGEKYFAERMNFYFSLPESHSLAMARHQLIATAFAVRRFMVEHKGLPPRLDVLRPTYLSRLPTDPFSGEPFRYDAQKALLYSVGRNLTDDGGKPESPSLADANEPAVKLGAIAATPVR